MNLTFGPVLFLVNSVAFLLVGFVTLVRLEEARGSLRPARNSFAMSAFCAAWAFMVTFVQQLVYDPSGSQNLLVVQLFIPANLFAMLVLAFLASFAIFATYSGKRRKLIVSLIFAVALIPIAYLALTYSELDVGIEPASIPGSYELLMTLPVMILFALCAIPLGVIPAMAFGRSFMAARKRGDRVLSQRGAMMFSAVVINMVAFLMFMFPFWFLRSAALMFWIPVELFLLYAVLKITSPTKPSM